LSGVLQDWLAFARKVRRRPAWALSVVLVLALGISANTAMFAAFDAWVTRPFPFPDSEQLVTLNETQRDQVSRWFWVSPRNLLDWREQESSFQSLAGYRRSSFNLADDGDPARVLGARVAHGLFRTLGVSPVLGRDFREADEVAGQQPSVALVSYRLWRERYAGDRDVLGRTLRLDGFPYEIIGVMPEGFRFPDWQEVWVPLGVEPRSVARDERWLSVVGRLRPEVTAEAAAADLQRIAAQIERGAPETNAGWSASVLPLRHVWVPEVIDVALTVSLFTGVFVLLIVCANVASLMLAEASARSHQDAVRSALGASRWRLARPVLVENISLAALAGCVAAYLSVHVLAWMAGRAPIEPPYLFDMRIDARSLWFTAGASLVAGVVVACAPVLRRSAHRLADELKAGARSSSGLGAARIRRGLVVAELALSTALAIGALLLVKSFWNQQSVDPGYRIDEVYSMELSLAGPALEGPASRVAFVARLEEQLRDSPEVTRVGVSDGLPSHGGDVLRVETSEVRREAQEGERVLRQVISSDYLETLDVALLSGRRFTSTEMREGGDVAVVSSSLARALWGNGGALGRHLRRAGSAEPWLRVVGITEDVLPPRDMVQNHRPSHQLYRPYGSMPGSAIQLVVQSSHPPEAVASAVRRAVSHTGLPVPVSEVLTMEQALRRSQWVTRMFSEMLGAYAAFALLIAAVGLFGLVSDSVNLRSREIAIRLAMGAGPGRVERRVIGGALAMGAMGLGLGVALGTGAAFFAGSMLTGVQAADPLVLSLVTGLLASTLLAASYGPARRAARTDPARALRAE
jgi:putative ABC transport system permease protein